MANAKDNAVRLPGIWQCPACGVWSLPVMAKCAKCGAIRAGNGALPMVGHGEQVKTAATGQEMKARKCSEPNKTEIRYNREMLAGRGQYEAITLRMANGHRYTADWYDATTRTLHEVKGAHKFNSHQRARLAFDQARVEFAEFNFVWATRTKSGEWKVEKYEGKNNENR